MVWFSRKVGLAGGATMACGAIAAFLLGDGAGATRSQAIAPDLVVLRPGPFLYRVSGTFTRNGKPARAPLVRPHIAAPLAVMRHQVTEAEYRRCAEEGACAMSDRDRDLPASDRPMVKVSWQDAQTYAAWLSRETGMRFRLPTDDEWAFAAGSRFTDDALPEGVEESDPGRRALAVYEREESSRGAVGQGPQPIGSFGTNENGLQDLAGNVWEWTGTCFTRNTVDAEGQAHPAMVSCGVRVVEGRHRAYITDFIRDARAGGCAAGTPPSYLGFRLVRDDSPSLRLAALPGIRWLVSLFGI